MIRRTQDTLRPYHHKVPFTTSNEAHSNSNLQRNSCAASSLSLSTSYSGNVHGDDDDCDALAAVAVGTDGTYTCPSLSFWHYSPCVLFYFCCSDCSDCSGYFGWYRSACSVGSDAGANRDETRTQTEDEDALQT